MTTDPRTAALEEILDICDDAVDAHAALQLIEQRAKRALETTSDTEKPVQQHERTQRRGTR